jgi:hypothetical protein
MPEISGYRIKIADLPVLLIVLILSGAAFYWLPKRQIGTKCLLYLSGKPYAKIDLSSKMTLDTLRTKEGMVVIEYGEQKVRVLKSSCPNKICVKQGWISAKGQSLACIPNRFLAVIPDENGEPDAVTN